MCVKLGTLPLETVKSLPLSHCVCVCVGGWGGLTDGGRWEPSHIPTGTKHLPSETRRHSAVAKGGD